MKGNKILSRVAAVVSAACLIGVVGTAQAQTSVNNASYDASGNIQAAGQTFTLNTFTVSGIYTGGSTTTESVFITDGTANARIFGAVGLFTGVTVGAQYTAGITTSTFQATEEFTTPTNLTAANTTAPVLPISAMLSQIANTTHIAASPSDAAYATTGALLFAPITFTITPTTSGTLFTTGNTSSVLQDQASGLSVTLFRAATAFAYTAGQTYTVTGFEQPFTANGVTTASEIVGAYAFSAVPEPSTDALLAVGGIALAAIVRRRIGWPRLARGDASRHFSIS